MSDPETLPEFRGPSPHGIFCAGGRDMGTDNGGIEHLDQMGRGTVGYFVLEAGFRHWLTNLSPNATANCVLASNHSRGGRFHSAAA